MIILKSFWCRCASSHRVQNALCTIRSWPLRYLKLEFQSFALKFKIAVYNYVVHSITRHKAHLLYSSISALCAKVMMFLCAFHACTPCQQSWILMQNFTFDFEIPIWTTKYLRDQLFVVYTQITLNSVTACIATSKACYNHEVYLEMTMVKMRGSVPWQSYGQDLHTVLA